VGSVIDELRASGNMVDELRRVDQYARLHVTTAEGRFVEIDMGVDYREGAPVTLSVGPVLSLDDAVANKVGALYSRADARDYLDAIKERLGDWAAELRSSEAEQTATPQLDPELQRIVDLNKLSYPTSASEMRLPEHGSVEPGRGYLPPQQGHSNDHGYGR
jgi:hypothetical protein